MDKKYGLQLRVKTSQAKKPKPSAAFGGDDDDLGDDVEQEIYRQAYKNKSLKDVEEQQKKALEEDPSVFDYDGVYDQIKQKAARPVAHDKQERKPKYIAALIEKNKQREREHEVVYERKLAKERDQDAHLFADKDKFVTGAYKRKLAEQAKWAQEERLRELREAKDDVTNKKDMTDFYFDLHKNVAFGGREAEFGKSEKQHEGSVSLSPSERSHVADKVVKQHEHSVSSQSHVSDKVVQLHERSISPSPSERSHVADKVVQLHERSVSPSLRERSHAADSAPVSGGAFQETAAELPTETEQLNKDHHKRSLDALAEARQRFLARKKAKDQQSLHSLDA